MHSDAPTLFSQPTRWLELLSADFDGAGVDGLVPVKTYDRDTMRPEEFAIMEKAEHYGAQFVFFEAGRNNCASVPQAFVYVSDGRTDNEFADLHRRLWNWGGVPLVYRKVPGKVDLFRCAHTPEFFRDGKLTYKPHKIFNEMVAISKELAYWDATQLRNGTLWDNPATCDDLLSKTGSAHRELVKAVKGLNDKLTKSNLLDANLRRQLLILTLLIEYLEERGVLKPENFSEHLSGATRFFDVLRNGPALVALFNKLKTWFNGDVFTLTPNQEQAIRTSAELDAFATLVEGYQEPSGQLNFWRLYSFDDLPVELISEIYQLFVKDKQTAVYTPPALVRLILEEVLDKDRMDRLLARKEVVLDPACGSGVFLVEAYKRLILHWRSQNDWKPPTTAKLQELAKFVHGVDIEPTAIELTNFSLCLAMCDALKPRDIEKSVELFPALKGKSLHGSCFFSAQAEGVLSSPIGVIVGNPPFTKKLSTEGAEAAYKRYCDAYGNLPGVQLAYLFLHEAMAMLEAGGVLAMIQHCGLLYNRGAEPFRRNFFDRWNVREVLDFVSVRGMFSKDTMVVAIVATADAPAPDRQVLHAIFRRDGRADAEQRYETDYYDLHWLPAATDWSDFRTWRSNLLGGARVASFWRQVSGEPSRHRTLGEFAVSRGWHVGKGFEPDISANPEVAEYPHGELFLPTNRLTKNGIVPPIDQQSDRVTYKSFRRALSAKSYASPLLLVKAHMDLYRATWDGDPLTFRNEIVGFSGPGDATGLNDVDDWISGNHVAIAAFVAATSSRLFNSKATAIDISDIRSIPFPEDKCLGLSENEKIISEDIVDYMREFAGKADKSKALKESGIRALGAFSNAFLSPINGIYTDNPLIAHPAQVWPGIICQPYSFGPTTIDWTDTEKLRSHLDKVLKDRESESLSVTRIARIYDGNMLFLIKPDRLRFWLRSIALRDADEVLADLRSQGY